MTLLINFIKIIIRLQNIYRIKYVKKVHLTNSRNQVKKKVKKCVIVMRNPNLKIIAIMNIWKSKKVNFKVHKKKESQLLN